jgi:hypothetical protein
VTSDGTPPLTPTGRTGGPVDPGVDIVHLVHRRDLDIPAADHAPLAEYWTHLRQLRAEVDERLLADREIAVTWSSAGTPDAG